MSLCCKLVVFLLVLLTVVPCAFSIKCFYCRSSNDPKCADPFDNSTIPIKDCDQEKAIPGQGLRISMCQKILQKVNGEWLYTRDCTFSEEVGVQGDETLCVTKTGSDNILTEYCTCNSKDACNSSYLFTPKPVMLVALVLLPWLLLKLVA